MEQQTLSTSSSLWVLSNDTIEETIDYLVAAGKKVGVVKGSSVPSVLRTGSLSMLIPETVKQISVLDRTKSQDLLASLCTLML